MLRFSQASRDERRSVYEVSSPRAYLDLVWIVTYLKCVNRIEFNELLGV